MAKTSRKTTRKTTRKKKSATKPAARSRSAKTTASKKKSVTTKRKTKAKTTAKAKTKSKTSSVKSKQTTKKTSKSKAKTTTRKKASRGAMQKKPTTKKTPRAASGTMKTAKKAPSTSKKRKSTAGANGTSQETSARSKKARSVAEVASAAAVDDKGYVFINGRRVRMISTQGAPRKKTRNTAASAVVAEEEAPPKPTKTRLSKKELNHYRQILLEKRADIIGDLDAMETAALRSSGGDVSHMPIHMADIGSDTYDQDFTLGLAETERKQLREIDEALQRIEDKTYGVCMMTGKDIPKARLDAKPWARYTIEAARIVESQQSR